MSHPRRCPQRRPARPAPTPSPGPRRAPLFPLLVVALALIAPRPLRADENGTWSRLHPRANPLQAFVADPVEGGAYLVDCTTGMDPGVWRIAPDGRWTEVPTHGQGPTGTRPLTALYDPARAGFVLFDPTLARAWRLDRSGAWSALPVAGAPLGLRGTLVFDTRRERALLFGGTEAYATDVWACDVSGDTARWERLPAADPQPAPRIWAMAVYDPPRDRLVVAGGYWIASNDANIVFTDTWEYPLESPAWRRLAVADVACEPSGWVGGAATGVVDAAGDRIVRIRENCASRRVVTTLAPGDSAWRVLGPPDTAPEPVGLPPVYDPARDRVLLPGSVDGGAALFAMDAATGRWTQLEPAWSVPYPRSAHAAAYVPTLDAVAVTAGRGIASTLDDTWRLALGSLAWSRVHATPAPAPRTGCVLVSNAPASLTLFGGDTGHVTDDDAMLRLTDRTPGWFGTPHAGPPPRARHAAVVPLGHRSMLVFGGEGDSVPGGRRPLNDTWLLDGGAWHEMHTTGGPPPPRAGHTMIWDASRRRAIVHGGDSTYVDGTGAHRRVLGDTWVLTLADSTWRWLPPFGPAVTAHSAVYDAVRDRMLVYGGRTANGVNDLLWAMDCRLELWTQIAPAGAAPTPRANHVAVYDPVRDRMIVHGGAVAVSTWPSRDTWLLDFGGTARPAVSVEWTPPPWPGAAGHLRIVTTPHTAAPIPFVVQAGFGSGMSYAWLRTLATGHRDTVDAAIALPDSVEGDVPAFVRLSSALPLPDDTLHFFAHVPQVVVEAHAERDGSALSLTWDLGDAAVVPVAVYRRIGGGEWALLGSPVGSGKRWGFVDADPPAGLDVTYGLGVRADGTELVRGAVTVAARGDLGMAVRVWPSPARGAVSVAFTLASPQPVQVEVFDLAGRVRLRLPGGLLAPGTHLLRLDDTVRLDAGLYFVRLQRGMDVVTRRLCVVK